MSPERPKRRAIRKAPDGNVMMVVRPEEVGDYVVVGYLAEGTDGVIVDVDGIPIDRLVAGDSVVSA